MTKPAATRPRKQRPLPRKVQPVENETTVSFVRRLAKANHIRPDELISYLGAWMSTSGRAISVSPRNLADAAGTDVRHLFRALPQLQGQAEPEADWAGEPPDRLMGMATEIRLACRRCMAAKGIFTAVTVLAWTDENLCLRHQLWTGHGVAAVEDQADVSAIPEIGRAQIRLSRLFRRCGPRNIWYAYQIAEAVIEWSSRESSSQTARQERLRRFLASTATGALPRSYDYAAYYPEVVGILSVIASPYWQRMAGSADPDAAARLYRQLTASGLTRGDPSQNTPLRSWLVQLREENIRRHHANLAQYSDKVPRTAPAINLSHSRQQPPDGSGQLANDSCASRRKGHVACARSAPASVGVNESASSRPDTTRPNRGYAVRSTEVIPNPRESRQLEDNDQLNERHLTCAARFCRIPAAPPVRTAGSAPPGVRGHSAGVAGALRAQQFEVGMQLRVEATGRLGVVGQRRKDLRADHQREQLLGDVLAAHRAGDLAGLACLLQVRDDRRPPLVQ